MIPSQLEPLYFQSDVQGMSAHSRRRRPHPHSQPVCSHSWKAYMMLQSTIMSMHSPTIRTMHYLCPMTQMAGWGHLRYRIK